MVFGHSLSWYLRFVRKPFIAASLIIVSVELISRSPQLVGFTLIGATPVVWLAKLVGSFIVGYRIAEVERRLMQSIIGGAIFGIGIGIIGLVVSMFQMISLVQPSLFAIFGGFSLFFTVGNEMVYSALFAAIGAVLAGGRLESW